MEESKRSLERMENSHKQSFERMEAHLKRILDILKEEEEEEEEEECQSESVTTPHGYNVEEEDICYREDESSPINWSQHYHEEESPLIYWPQQYQEEECQSQLVTNPNGHYMEDEGTYYHE
jgi:hypothetical protein